MPADLLRSVAEEVVLAEGAPEGERLPVSALLEAEQIHCAAFRPGDERAPVRGSFQAASQCAPGGEVEVAQKRILPVVPQAGVGGADVRDGEEIQAVEVQAIAHGPGELLDDGRIRGVPPLGGMRHQEMMPDQPLDEMRVVGVESMPAAKRESAARSDLGMIAFLPLADVVKQAGDVQQLRIRQLLEQGRAQGERAAPLRQREGTQAGDHEETVLVHGVRVEEVVLHPPGHDAELGQIRRQQSVTMHAAHLAGDMARLAQDLQEDRAGLRVGPKRAVDEVTMIAHQPNGGCAYPLHFGSLLENQEELEQRDGMAGGNAGIRELQPLVDRPEAGVDRPRFVRPGGRENRFAEQREQHFVESRQLRDTPVVALHELLDAEIQIVVAVSEKGGEAFLVVEEQAVFRPPGEQVQAEPDLPEEVSAFAEITVLRLGEAGVARGAAQRPRAEVTSRDPVHAVDVPQPARAVLDVGLEVRRGVVESTVPFPLLEAAGLEEGRSGPQAIRTGALEQLLEKRGRPREEACFHEGGGKNGIVARVRLALVHAAHAVPDPQADVPDEGDEAPDAFLAAAAQGAVHQDEKIDIGMRVQLAPPVAADRYQARPRLPPKAAVRPRAGQQRVDFTGPGRHERNGTLSGRMSSPQRIVDPHERFPEQDDRGAALRTRAGVASAARYRPRPAWSVPRIGPGSRAPCVPTARKGSGPWSPPSSRPSAASRDACPRSPSARW